MDFLMAMEDEPMRSLSPVMAVMIPNVVVTQIILRTKIEELPCTARWAQSWSGVFVVLYRSYPAGDGGMLSVVALKWSTFP